MASEGAEAKVLYEVPTPSSLYRFDRKDSQFRSCGQAAVTVKCLPGALYQLVCRQANSSELVVGSITKKDRLEFTIQTDSYVHFKSDTGDQYSLYFRDEAQSRMLAMQILLAMYLSAGSPTHSITSMDVVGGGGPTIEVGDAVGVKYNGFVVTPEGRLGEQYDGNEQSKRTYKFATPASNAKLDSTMKGFEGAIQGMKEGGSRLMIIPAACRGVRSADTLLFAVDVKRIKKDSRRPHVPTVIPRAPTVGSNEDAKTDLGPDESVAGDAESVAPPPTESAAPISPAPSLPLPSFHQYQQQQQQLQQHQPIAMLALPGMYPGQGALSLPPPPSPAEPPVPREMLIPPSQFRSVTNTEATVTQLLSSTSGLVSSVALLGEKLDNLGSEVRDIRKKPTDLPPPTAKACDDLVAILTDYQQLRDGVLSKERRIKELELALADRPNGPRLAIEDLPERGGDGVGAEEERLAREEVTRTLKVTEQRLQQVLDENQQFKGQVTVARMEAESLTKKLTDSDLVLQSERARAQKAEDKVRELTEALMEARDDAARKKLLWEEALRKIETDKAYFNRMLDDERRRSEEMADSLRDEMLSDLLARDSKYQAEKQRLADEHFTMGVDHGREITRAENRLKWEGEVRELRLENQRLAAQLEATRAELQLEKATSKGTIDRLCSSSFSEDGQGNEVPALLAHVEALKDQLHAAHEKLAAREADLATANLRVSYSEQQLHDTETRCVSAVVALSRQSIPKHSLVTLLQQIFRGQHVDTSFDREMGGEDEKKGPVAKPSPTPAEMANAAGNSPQAKPLANGKKTPSESDDNDSRKSEPRARQDDSTTLLLQLQQQNQQLLLMQMQQQLNSQQQQQQHFPYPAYPHYQPDRGGPHPPHTAAHPPKSLPEPETPKEQVQQPQQQQVQQNAVSEERKEVEPTPVEKEGDRLEEGRKADPQPPQPQNEAKGNGQAEEPLEADEGGSTREGTDGKEQCEGGGGKETTGDAAEAAEKEGKKDVEDTAAAGEEVPQAAEQQSKEEGREDEGDERKKVKAKKEKKEKKKEEAAKEDDGVVEDGTQEQDEGGTAEQEDMQGKKKKKKREEREGDVGQPHADAWTVGTVVQAIYNGEWYPATIGPQEPADGMVTVTWEADGTVATVPESEVKAKRERRKSKKKDEAEPVEEEEQPTEAAPGDVHEEDGEAKKPKKEKKEKKEKKKKTENEEEDAGPADPPPVPSKPQPVHTSLLSQDDDSEDDMSNLLKSRMGAQRSTPALSTGPQLSAVPVPKKPLIFAETDSEDDDLIFKALARKGK